MSNKTIQKLSVPIEVGDLLKCPDDVIVQQCNCISIRSLGLAKSISEQFGVYPYGKRCADIVNTYVADEKTSDKPGTTIVSYSEDGTDPACRLVASLFAQWAPGSCKKQSRHYQTLAKKRGMVETAEKREKWFRQCLEKLANYLDNTPLLSDKKGAITVAFPFLIGCGLGGGDWNNYYQMIEDWSNKNPGLIVRIIKLK